MTSGAIAALLCLRCGQFGGDETLETPLEAGAEADGRVEPTAEAGPPGVVDSGEPDADRTGAACSSVAVAGIDKDVGMAENDDDVDANEVDAYRYEVVKSATVRCASVFVRSLGTNDVPIDVHFGVYASGPLGPTELKTQAVLKRVAVGWNAAVLDQPLKLEDGALVWLALVPTTSSVQIVRDTATDCSADTGGVLVAAPEAQSRLPSSWPPASSPNPAACHARLFLGE